MDESGSRTDGLSRRGFISATAAISLVVKTDSRSAHAQGVLPSDPRTKVSVSFELNGNRKSLELDNRTVLLDALREHVDSTGTKKGCDHGQCGACTVLINNRRVLSCLTLAVAIEGRQITTIEGLAKGDELHPMQQAFVDNDALQCGYCTPGQIVSAVACVNEGHANTDAEIREYMSGNICRCGAYPNIVAAINQAKEKMPVQKKAG